MVGRTFTLQASSGLAANDGLLRFREGDKLTADGRLVLDIPRQGKISVTLMCALSYSSRKAAKGSRNPESNDCVALEPISPPLSPPAEDGVSKSLLKNHPSREGTIRAMLFVNDENDKNEETIQLLLTIM